MKSPSISVLMTLALLSLTACSQQAAKVISQPTSSSKTYYIETQKKQAQQIVFQRKARPQSKPAPYRQTTSQQQVRRPVLQKPQVPGGDISELYGIGNKIFKNETGGRIDQLTHWNLREDFASMGIGHFTWYPANRKQRYGNTFPGLLDYLKQNGVQLPQWVQKARFEGAPWRTREELMRAKNTPQVKQFSQLLYDTRHLQAKYIMDRAMRAMPKLVKTTPPHLRRLVANNLNAVANSRGGRYVLVDYTNFKGEGLSRNGGYKGQNWGLLQVLENMRPSQPGPRALNEFADASMRILERRVRNSDPRRNERKWLPGWRNRTNTYRNPI